jgi:NAD(P)-dependent dehydrogenase (short-subunit alcohol dehydrogenase family)
MLDQVDPRTVEQQKKVTAVGKRLGTAEEVAAIVSFLVEERSSWVSEQCKCEPNPTGLRLLLTCSPISGISASGGYQFY